MSQENVEIVRQAWEAWVRRDNETGLAMYDPEIVIDTSGQSGLDTGLYHGLEGVQKFHRNWLSVFTAVGAEVEEWIDAGDDVIAMVRWCGRGRESGVPVEMLRAHLWTVRDGKLRRLRILATKAEALEAAGLSE